MLVRTSRVNAAFQFTKRQIKLRRGVNLSGQGMISKIFLTTVKQAQVYTFPRLP